jgi:hypothetical protein
VKTYKVLGSQPVMGHAQGEQFSANIPPPHEKRLLDRGSIKVVEKKKSTAKKTTRKGKQNA